MPDLIPSSVAKSDRNTTVLSDGTIRAPLYCMNCGDKVGWCKLDAYGENFYGWQCSDCVEKYGDKLATMLIPCQVFWQKVNDAQMEAFGRILSMEEQLQALQDPNHILSKLAKDRLKELKR